jgi:hypothetical protein
MKRIAVVRDEMQRQTFAIQTMTCRAQIASASHEWNCVQ